MDMDRATHLRWCKDRALEYVELGDWNHAISSMISDLRKHPETYIDRRTEGELLALLLHQQTEKKKLINWINGFN